MPKHLTELTISTAKSILKTVDHYGFTFVFSVIVLALMVASFVGIIPLPWTKLKEEITTSVKAQQKEETNTIVEKIAQQHMALMQSQADHFKDVVESNHKNCQMLARIYRKDESFCTQ